MSGCYSRHGLAPRQQHALVTCRKRSDPVGVDEERLYKETYNTISDKGALLGGEGMLLKAWPGFTAKASPRHLRRVPEPIHVGEDLWHSTLLDGEGPLLKAWPGSKAKASPHHLKRVRAWTVSAWVRIRACTHG